MSSITDNMGLTVWDNVNDYFNHSELAANFEALDDHDHTTGKGVQVPAGGLAPASVSTANLINGSVTSDKILDGTITEDDLASPTSGSYRTIFEGKGFLPSDAAAGTYLLGSANIPGTSSGMVTSGTAMAPESSKGSIPPDLFYFDDADYTVSGLSTKFRINVQVAINATTPTNPTSFTFKLAPITVAGAADSLVYTAGVSVSTDAVHTVTTSQTSAILTRASATHSGGTDFSLSTDGVYGLAVVTSATLANSCSISCHAQLQVHWI